MAGSGEAAAWRRLLRMEEEARGTVRLVDTGIGLEEGQEVLATDGTAAVVAGAQSRGVGKS